MKKSNAFLISLLAHTTLSLILFFYLKQIDHDTTKATISNYLPSYAISTQNNYISQKEKILGQKIIPPKKIATNKMNHPHINMSLKSATKKISSPSSMTLQTSSLKKIDTLLSLLHQQIAAKQSYPEAALLLQQNGTVRIGFLLFPDGHISQISVLQSSGINSIDASALSALKEIIPVKEASSYLQKERYFSVDVVFK